MSNWQKVKIGDVCTITKGVIGIQKAIAGEYPMISLAEERATHNEFQFDCEAVIIPLVSSTGHGHASMKRVHYQKGKFAVGSILCAVIPNDTNFLNPKYLHIYLSYLKDKLLVPLMRGAANVSLSIANIKTVEVVVPPIDRQLEIIELEKILRRQKQKLDQGNLFQKSHLTLLRQQILQDAISGKLTTDWRAKNPDTEPASDLLKQIKAEKEKLIAEKKIKKGKPLPPIAKDEVPFELPEGWEWCRLGEITIYGTSKKVEPKNILDDTWILDLEDIEKESSRIINYENYKNRKSNSTKSIFKKGDILYSKLRPYLDKVVVAPKDGVCTTEILPLPIFGGMDSSFYMYAMKRRDFLRYADQKVKGMKMPRLGTEDGKRALFPLPPRAEQRAIVAKVERLMKDMSQLDKKIAQNANNAETLMQAFLGEVFESKL